VVVAIPVANISGLNFPEPFPVSTLTLATLVTGSITGSMKIIVPEKFFPGRD